MHILYVSLLLRKQVKQVRLDELVSLSVATPICLLNLKCCHKTGVCVTAVCAQVNLFFSIAPFTFGFCWFFSTVFSFLKCNIWLKAFGVSFTNSGVIWLLYVRD